jgi:hypothetical protein
MKAKSGILIRFSFWCGYFVTAREGLMPRARDGRGWKATEAEDQRPAANGPELWSLLRQIVNAMAKSCNGTARTLRERQTKLGFLE